MACRYLFLGKVHFAVECKERNIQMNKFEELKAKLAEQTKGYNENSRVCTVAEHLLAIIGNDEAAAEMVLQDLANDAMHIKFCEKKIEAFASGNKDGNVGFCPPRKAEEIICNFYGLAEPQAEKAKTPSASINLLDFM